MDSGTTCPNPPRLSLRVPHPDMTGMSQAFSSFVFIFDFIRIHPLTNLNANVSNIMKLPLEQHEQPEYQSVSL